MLAGLTGCVTLPGAKSEKVSIRVHVWQALSTPPRAAPLGIQTAPVFTYVLMGDVGDAALTPEGDRARQRLAPVLAGVQEGGRADSLSVDPSIAEAYRGTNVFSIPCKDRAADLVNVANYGYALSRDYVNALKQTAGASPDLKEALEMRGPFLVSLPKPMPLWLKEADGGKDPPVLFVNLSALEAPAVADSVNRYKRSVRDGVSASREANDIRDVIASAMMNLNGAIRFVFKAGRDVVKEAKV